MLYVCVCVYIYIYISCTRPRSPRCLSTACSTRTASPSRARRQYHIIRIMLYYIIFCYIILYNIILYIIKRRHMRSGSWRPARASTSRRRRSSALARSRTGGGSPSTRAAWRSCCASRRVCRGRCCAPRALSGWRRGRTSQGRS